jgi:hypothetical protein
MRRAPHHEELQTEKSTSAIMLQTCPNFNTICGHIPGLQPRSGERFGAVVVEIDSKNA